MQAFLSIIIVSLLFKRTFILLFVLEGETHGFVVALFPLKQYHRNAHSICYLALAWESVTLFFNDFSRYF